MEGVTVYDSQPIKLSKNFYTDGKIQGIIAEKISVPGFTNIFAINATVVDMTNTSNTKRVVMMIESLSGDTDYIVDVNFSCGTYKGNDVITYQRPTSKPFKVECYWQGRIVYCIVSFELNFTKQSQLSLGCSIPKTLVGDLKSFLDDGPIVTLVGSDGEVKVAKLLLQIRSSVLKAMFSHDMQESQSSAIELKDFDSKTLQSFCNYMMTDKMDEEKEITLGLYILADKYDVQGLKKSAEQFMLNNLKDFDKEQVYDLLFKTNPDLFRRLLDEKYHEN